MRKSSSRASAPSMRFSVLLNSCDNFLVTLPQFSQKLELCSLPVIWEHLGFATSCSWDVPHSFLYLRLLVSFCFVLPFLREKRFQ